jgi:hypothetical protein
MKLMNNLISRFEFRRDFSNRDFFTNSAGAARNNQNTVIFVSGSRLFGVRRLRRRFGSPLASQALARPRPLRKVPVSWKRTNESRTTKATPKPSHSQGG